MIVVLYTGPITVNFVWRNLESASSFFCGVIPEIDSTSFIRLVTEPKTCGLLFRNSPWLKSRCSLKSHTKKIDVRLIWRKIKILHFLYGGPIQSIWRPICYHTTLCSTKLHTNNCVQTSGLYWKTPWNCCICPSFFMAQGRDFFHHNTGTIKMYCIYHTYWLICKLICKLIWSIILFIWSAILNYMERNHHIKL